MWFAALILFFTGATLLRGNLSAMHGKQFEAAKDKVGFGKAVGKIILFFVIIAAAIGWYAVVVRRYCS